MPNTKKRELVDKLIDSLKNTQNFALVTFEKTNHQALESLRKRLKKENAQFKVIKNTLLEKAINKLANSNKLFFEFKKKFLPFRDLTALIILSTDWSPPLKTFYEFSQKEKSLSFKVGFIDKITYDEPGLSKLAKLPAKNELISSMLGNMKAPTTHFIYSLKYNVQKFVFILSQRSKKLS